MILQLCDRQGRVGWGEISPLPWFGSESLAQALAFCRQLPDRISEERVLGIPSHLPACQFGFESAWSSLQNLDAEADLSQLTYSALLPAGEQALQAWQLLWHQGYRTFKWKIAVYPWEQEQRILAQLVATLPSSAQLRLDANAGLDWLQATQWLQCCDQINHGEALPRIEFLEQPLAVDQFPALLDLSRRYATPLALDESVATLRQLQACYHQGWRGIFVIKPAIAGSPRQLRRLCHEYQLDWVASSVLETTIGRQAGLQLAATLPVSAPGNRRAVGYGTQTWIPDAQLIAGDADPFAPPAPEP